MATNVAIGSAEIPESEPAEPVVVVVPVLPSLTTDSYDVNLLLPSTLPEADVEITAQTEDEVTLTVTRPDGYAGTPGLTVYLICVEDIDTGWVDVSAALDAGWTAAYARIRQVDSVTYFQFDLTAAASINGTPKSDSVRVLDLSTIPIYVPDTGVLGACFTNSNQLMMMTSSGDIFVEGTSTATGSWATGSTFLFGQVSWVAAT